MYASSNVPHASLSGGAYGVSRSCPKERVRGSSYLGLPFYSWQFLRLWNHTGAQRTPNMKRLTAWYHAAPSRAIDCGVVTDVKSLHESDFEDSIRKIEAKASSDAAYTYKIACPPLLDGDFWIEEAVRVHGIAIARHSKEKSVPGDDAPASGALMICTILVQ